MPFKSGAIYVSPDSSKRDDIPSLSLLPKKHKKVSLSPLDNLVNNAERAIFEARSVFPFDFFPNSICIYANRVTITYRGLMYKDEFPILIESLTGARVTRTGVFSQLTIDTFGFKDSPPPVKFLKNSEARLSRRYILALIECKKAGIFLQDYPVKELRSKLKFVGKVREHTYGGN